MSRLVRAAGGVLWRRRKDAGLEVLLVHRPRYDDWSFPKGKCDPGESDTACARREVAEETGYVVELGRELPRCTYVDGRGRDKVVRYWEMQVRSGDFSPNDEVDAIRWVDLTAASSLLTYPRDRRVLEDFAALARS